MELKYTYCTGITEAQCGGTTLVKELVDGNKGDIAVSDVFRNMDTACYWELSADSSTYKKSKSKFDV
jgi:hypothetical protein